MADNQLFGFQSKKTGEVQKLTEEEGKKHMKLHGRRFIATGPVEDFTPEEVVEAEKATTTPKNSRQRALPQGPDSPAENSAS
jgi:hypothetical protein